MAAMDRVEIALIEPLLKSPVRSTGVVKAGFHRVARIRVLVYLPMPAVAYKLQPNPVIGIGLAVAEVAVGTVELSQKCVWFARSSQSPKWRGLRLTANAVTRLFMTTSSLGKCLPAPRTLHILV